MPETATALGAFIVSLTTIEASGAIALSAATYQAIGAVVIATASYAAQSALTPKPPSFSPAAQKQLVRQAVMPRRRGYGRGKIGGGIAFLQNKDAANINQPGTDGQLYVLVMLLSHEIDAFEEYWLGDVEVTIDGSGIVQEEPFLSEGWARAQLQTKLGTSDQAALSVLTTDFPGEWTTDHRLRGIALILGKFGSIEDKAFTRVFNAGIPAMRVVGRWAKVWDPRDIAQDPDDPSTWAWTTNGVLIVMDYLWHADGMRLPRELIELAIEDWKDKADAADAAVDILGSTSTEERFRLSGVYEHTTPPRDVLPLMCDPMGAELRMREDGAVIIELPDYYEPTVILTDDHIFSYSGLRRSPESGDIRNEIRARYLSPENGYEEQEADPWRNETSIALHGVKPVTLDLTWCPSHSQARRRMKLESYRMNPEWTGTIITNAYGLDCLGERLIRVQISELGIDIVCERTSFAFDPSTARCSIGIRSIDPEAFNWDSAEEGDAPIGSEPTNDGAPAAPAAFAAVLETSGSTMHFNLSFEAVTHSSPFYAQWSTYIPGQDEDDVEWQTIVAGVANSPPFVQADIAGTGVPPIRVRAWFRRADGIRSDFSYDIITSETTGAPGPVQYFDATGGTELILEFQAPTDANFSYVRILKANSGDPFGSAVNISGNIYTSPGGVRIIDYGNFYTGTFRLWAVAYSGTGQPSTEVLASTDPITVV